MTIAPRPSPNHDARPAGVAVDILLLHYTGMPSAAAALDRLCDPAAKVSAHYGIDEDGTVWALVDEDRRAWHAGVSCWAGERDVNGRAIGIELVNPGHEFGYRPFPEAQMAALQALAQAILARHPIPPQRVLGHSDVAPARKEDPGELFDWPRLARAGIGLWPDAFAAIDPAAGTAPDTTALQRKLAAYGYDVPSHGRPDETTRLVVAAFQRHFRPRRVDGIADGETAARLDALLEVIDSAA
jgi:N-acetylmuramoyl-L-alanine amidase